MKKFAPLVVLFTFALAACGPAPVLEDAEHRYFSTGQFAGWGGATEALDTDGETLKYLMEAVSVDDSRVASVKSEFSNPTMLYVKEVVLAEDQSWSKTYAITETATAVDYNGGLTLKIIQTDLDSPAPNYWAQSPESGKVNNLTPETLYVPPFLQTAPYTNAGDWNSDPVAFEAGTYTLVFGEQEFDGNAELFVALILVEAAA